VREGGASRRERVLRASVPTALFLIAAVLGTALPDQVNYFALFLLLLTRPVLVLLRRVLPHR